jgi:hypothetical protein
VAGVTTYTFGAGTGSLTGGLKFLSTDHVTVKVNGTSTSFTSPTGHGTFTITGMVPVGGESIVVSRVTPATEAGRVVNFEDLSHVRQSDLDNSSLQLLYLAQEGLDVVLASTFLALGAGGNWDGLNKRLENLLAGTASTDAVIKSQLDAVSVAAGSLPVVSAADNDKSLAVVAGAWAVRTPAQMRVHFGLGTAAVLNVGTGASQVAQLDGSARYPSNDGRNIDLTNNAVTTALGLRYRTTCGMLRNTGVQTPTNDATSTWSEGAGSRLSQGTKTSLDDSSNIVLSGTKVTLSAGTWEIQWILRAYNQNTTAGDDQILRVKLTDAVDGPTQVVYDNEYDQWSLEAAGGTNLNLLTAGNTILVKLAAGGDVVVRAANKTSTDIRISSLMVTYRKVSDSTT